jgi:hypothetical protein
MAFSRKQYPDLAFVRALPEGPAAGQPGRIEKLMDQAIYRGLAFRSDLKHLFFLKMPLSVWQRLRDDAKFGGLNNPVLHPNERSK